MASERKTIDLVTLRMVRESSLRNQYGSIKAPEDARIMIQDLIGDNDRECFGIICIDTKNRPTHINIVSIGTLNASMVHPREVFKAAILSNSASIIAFHNHPSGNTYPSETDIELTRRLVDVGEIIGIKLIDHIIVSDDGYMSMKEKMLI